MGKPRKIFTIEFKNLIRREIADIRALNERLKQERFEDGVIDDYLSALHGRFSKIELLVRQRQREVNE